MCDDEDLTKHTNTNHMDLMEEEEEEKKDKGNTKREKEQEYDCVYHTAKGWISASGSGFESLVLISSRMGERSAPRTMRPHTFSDATGTQNVGTRHSTRAFRPDSAGTTQTTLLAPIISLATVQSIVLRFRGRAFSVQFRRFHHRKYSHVIVRSLPFAHNGLAMNNSRDHAHIPPMPVPQNAPNETDG